MTQVLRAFAGVLLFSIVSTAQGEVTILRFAGVVDGTGEALDGTEIAVEDGNIAAVGDELASRYPEASTVTLDKLYALPGLIDAHVHMTYGLSGTSHGDAWSELLATPAPERLVAATRNARLTLESGVTTVRDLFAFDGLAYQLRALIDGGIVPGPRMFVSGEAIHPFTLPPADVGDGRDLGAELREFVAKRASEGADWIKIFATTGSADDLTGKQLYFYPELKAATDAAHEAGLRVAVHSYGPAAIPDALRAGVDSIEHPVDVDAGQLRRWANTGAFYVPTIDHNRYYAEHRTEYGYDDNVAESLHQFVDKNVEALRHANEANVRVAMGSDAVMTMFGQNTRELEWFILAGMTTAEAIRSATINGAELLGQSARLGKLSPGFAADIIAVEGDPLADIHSITRRVRWVMKGGDVVVDRTAE